MRYHIDVFARDKGVMELDDVLSYEIKDGFLAIYKEDFSIHYFNLNEVTSYHIIVTGITATSDCQ